MSISDSIFKDELDNKKVFS